jgi:mono/diheme cytochrome c family protein
MDIPVFHLDFLNNRLLIAIVAILHVVINHSMAVGGIPLVALLERRALQRGDLAADRLARRVLAVFFVVTTTLGAMSGVGIWFSTALVNPYAIGSLLRVFFWTWCVEWLVFVTEIALILTYYLTWKRWVRERKPAHVRLGVGLSLASWVTMALIVSILGFMMDPGAWRSDRTLFSGMLNPCYLPQLAFRTPLAMVMAGAAALFILPWVAKGEAELRTDATRTISRWMLAWVGPCVAGGIWYARAVPEAMRGVIPVALLTQALAGWSHGAIQVLALAASVVALLAAWGAVRPARMPRWALALPFVVSVVLIGTFERVREFIRKPYAIAGYLYSNGIRQEDYPLLQRDGLLAHATYTPVREVTKDNAVEAGREVFRLACTRCHTTDGVNGIRGVLEAMYGDQPWDPSAISAYVGAMHLARPFMPPFPGNRAERDALGVYLARLQGRRDALEGAQTAGAVSVATPKLP